MRAWGAAATDDRRLVRLAGLALPVAVWVLGIVPPPPSGLTAPYLLAYTGLLLALVVVDQTAPRSAAPLGRRLAWLAAEITLSFLVVREHGTLVRPALIYLLPVSRALLLFGERPGFFLGLAVWVAYAVNNLLVLWPERLHELANYLSFFLAPYVVAVVLTAATLRQADARRRAEALYAELQQAHERLQALHQRAREAAVTEERNRLAREIHDSLAHYLTVINVQLEAAEKLSADQPARALEQVRRARRLAVECLQDVRRSVSALRAATLEELSLGQALGKLGAEFGETTSLVVRLDMQPGADTDLAPEVVIALFRVAQEGLTNVQRHARAKRVTLSLARRGNFVELVVRDDGSGPADSGPNGSGSFGLLGLRERVELLGGRLEFGSGDHGGSRLAALIPLGGTRESVAI